jgi:membrane protein implicated in regulation of membrane protease activity
MAAQESQSGGSVLRRYLLFQLPDASAGALVLMLLVHFEVISVPVGWALFAVWIGKEIALYPLVRRAYEPSSASVTDALIGRTGVVTAALEENGYVRVGPELWRARANPGVAAPPIGAQVRIEAVDGYTISVVPLAEAEAAPSSEAEGAPSSKTEGAPLSEAEAASGGADEPGVAGSLGDP